MGTISFTNNKISSDITDKLLIKTFLASIFSLEGVEFESVSFIFCTDDYLLKLNQEFLKHNTFTDILTFTLSGATLPVVSEIYISVERVVENAKVLGEDYLTELHRVMIHGILHLCGYKDHSKREKAEMRRKENYYISRLYSK